MKILRVSAVENEIGYLIPIIAVFGRAFEMVSVAYATLSLNYEGISADDCPCSCFAYSCIELICYIC